MKLVSQGAKLECSMGDTASSLAVLPVNLTNAGNAPAATVQDFQPMAQRHALRSVQVEPQSGRASGDCGQGWGVHTRALRSGHPLAVGTAESSVYNQLLAYAKRRVQLLVQVDGPD